MICGRHRPNRSRCVKKFSLIVVVVAVVAVVAVVVVESLTMASSGHARLVDANGIQQLADELVGSPSEINEKKKNNVVDRFVVGFFLFLSFFLLAFDFRTHTHKSDRFHWMKPVHRQSLSMTHSSISFLGLSSALFFFFFAFE